MFRVASDMHHSFLTGIDRRNVEQVAQSHGIPDGFEFHESQRQNKWAPLTAVDTVGVATAVASWQPVLRLNLIAPSQVCAASGPCHVTQDYMAFIFHLSETALEDMAIVEQTGDFYQSFTLVVT